MKRRVLSRTALFFVVASLFHGAAVAAERSKPQVEALTVRLDRERAFVSFRIANGVTAETLERVHSGLSVSFRHRIELVDKRGAWVSTRMLAKTVVDTRAEYDLLTKQYTLTRRFRVSGEPKDATLRQDSLIVATESEMLAWMTTLDEIELIARDRAPIGGERLRVRVDSELDRKYILWIFPGKRSVSTEQTVEP